MDDRPSCVFMHIIIPRNLHTSCYWKCPLYAYKRCLYTCIHINVITYIRKLMPLNQVLCIHLWKTSMLVRSVVEIQTTYHIFQLGMVCWRQSCWSFFLCIGVLQNSRRGRFLAFVVLYFGLIGWVGVKGIFEQFGLRWIMGGTHDFEWQKGDILYFALKGIKWAQPKIIIIILNVIVEALWGGLAS